MTRNAAPSGLIARKQKATADAVVSGGGGAATLAHVTVTWQRAGGGEGEHVGCLA